MKVAFRADASLQMGSGHVMRCLTLAQALAAEGVECHFICREHPGNLIDTIAKKGFKVHALSVGDTEANESSPEKAQVLAHAHWLGASQVEDAAQTSLLLQGLEVDWLIVDHYGLDAIWEEALKPFYKRLMVIDDLADRKHVCDLLLDQNLGRDAQHYAGLVPDTCCLMIGPKFALLRPEFAELREYSLKRRGSGELKHILITMGGVDKPNATTKVLQSLCQAQLSAETKIIIVMGKTAPWLLEVSALAEKLPWETEVLVDVNNMAQIMADSDLAIGAAGSTTWERCCLGVPSILFVLADNQKEVGRVLADESVCIVFQSDEPWLGLANAVNSIDRATLNFLSAKSMSVTDGRGVCHIVRSLI